MHDSGDNSLKATSAEEWEMERRIHALAALRESTVLYPECAFSVSSCLSNRPANRQSRLLFLIYPQRKEPSLMQKDCAPAGKAPAGSAERSTHESPAVPLLFQRLRAER